MREILFRGKDLSGVLTRSWIFGSLDTTENEYTIVPGGCPVGMYENE